VAYLLSIAPIEPASSQRSEDTGERDRKRKTPLLLLLNLDRLFIKKIVFFALGLILTT
jgi:hypothetical protein